MKNAVYRFRVFFTKRNATAMEGPDNSLSKA